VCAPNAGRRSGEPHMYWPHIWWLNQTVTRGVDCNERCLYAALIIYCVDCSVAESFNIVQYIVKKFILPKLRTDCIRILRNDKIRLLTVKLRTCWRLNVFLVSGFRYLIPPPPWPHPVFYSIFRFVSKLICLFRLFRYGFETAKRMELYFCLVSRNEPKIN
jgi:hypothetical protein